MNKKYKYFYYNIGPNIIGISSGLYVASKIKITCPQYKAFPGNFLSGRAKFCRKGFFSFEISSKNKISIISTHLGHSETPQYPTKSEINSRGKQINMIKQEMEVLKQKNKNLTFLVSGDLNMSENEIEIHEMSNYLDRGNIPNKFPTWDGDYFSSLISKKPFSAALTLDYTFLSHPSLPVYSLETYCESSLFNHKKLDLVSLSDHCGLYSVVSLKKEN